MPDIPQNTYNRQLDFLNTGYANLRPIEGGTGIFPVSPNPNVPINPVSALDSIFANLRQTTSQKNPFLQSTAINQPIKTPLAQTARYGSLTYGYDPLNPNLEYQYGDRQSAFRTWGNGIIKFLANTTGSFVESLVVIPELIAAATTGDISQLYDNPLTNSVGTWLENLETQFPTYETTANKNHPVLSWIPFANGSASNWLKLLQNLGYTAGSIAGSLLTDAVIGAFTGGIGEAPLIGLQIMKAFGKLGKFYTAEKGGITGISQSIQRFDQVKDAIENSAKTLKALDRFRYALAVGTSAIAEGTFEANQTFRNIQRQLTQDYIDTYGYDPTGAEAKRIEQYARSGGNADMFANVALLSLTNSLVFGSLFKPINAAKKSVQAQILGAEDVVLKQGSLDVFEKAVKPKSKLSILTGFTSNVTRPIRVSLIEGVEEGSQFAIQRSAEEYYKRKFKDQDTNDVDNFVKSLSTGLSETLTTKEGLENVFMGLLSGVVIHAGRGALERRKGINNNKNSLITSTLSILNNQRVSGLFKNTYDEAVTAESIRKDMEKALNNNDLFEFKNLKFQQLFNFVESGVRSNRFDLRIDQLNMLKELKPSEFEQMFSINFSEENKKTVNDFVDTVIAKAHQIKTNIDKVNRVFTNPYPKNTNDHLLFNEYKTQLSLDLSEVDDNKRRLRQLATEITFAAPMANVEEVINLTNDKGMSDTIIGFQKRVDELSDSIENAEDKKSDFYKEQVRERGWLQNKIVGLREALEDFNEDDYRKHARELINYYANGKSFKADNLVSDIDVNDILQKAQDSFKLISASDRALYHYQQLTSPKGFSEFFADVVQEYGRQEAKFEQSEVLKDDKPESRQPAVTETGDIEDIQEIDSEGTPVPKTPTSPVVPQGTIRIGTAVPPFVDATERVALPFEEDEDIQEGVEQAMGKQKGVNKNSNKWNASPVVLFTKLYSKNRDNGVPEKDNLRDVVFSRTPASVYNTLTLSVKESTQGMKKGTYRAFKEPNLRNIHYTGYDVDIEVYSNGKLIGLIQPADRLSYRKEGKRFLLANITPEDYQSITGNDPSTYADFITAVKAHQAITDKIVADFKTGKTQYTNEEVKKLFDIIVRYGNIKYAQEASATLLKDIKYKGKGSAILSFPTVYNKEKKVWERTSKPEILNRKELGEQEIADVFDFLKDNIDQITAINSRYIYLMKLPDGKFSKVSPIAARPVRAGEETTKDLFKAIQTAKQNLEKGNLAKINTDLKEKIYIADSNNRKGSKSRMYLSLDKSGTLFLNVYNELKEFRRGIRVQEAQEARNFEELVDIINQKLQKVARQNSDLDKLNLKLSKEDFKSGILQDDVVGTEQLENNLTLAVTPNVFDDFSLVIEPLGQPRAAAPVTPKPAQPIAPAAPVTPPNIVIQPLSDEEQTLFDAIRDNIEDIQGAYKPSIKSLLDDPSYYKDIVSTVLSQYVDSWKTGRKVFGDKISDAISKILPEAAKAEQQDYQTFQVAPDKKSLVTVFSTLFNLKPRQASAVAEIYDRTAETWAIRNNSTKQEFYKKLAFTTAKEEDLLKAQQEGAEINFESQEFQKELAEVKKKFDGNPRQFKAPNGKMSNLSAEQWYIVQTPTFKKWFGDSKVVDENGEPQVMYHGTAKTWDVFDPTKGTRNVGLFLTPEPDFAEDYGKTIIQDAAILSLFVKSVKPFDYQNEAHLKQLEKFDKIYARHLREIETEIGLGSEGKANWYIMESPHFQDFLKQKGYDGYYVKEQGIKNLAVYQPNQVKDATGKNQTFLNENPSIYFQGLGNSAMIANVVKGFNLKKVKGFGNLAFQTESGKATPNLANKINDWLKDNGFGNRLRFVYEATHGTVNPFINEGNVLFQANDPQKEALVYLRNTLFDFFKKKGISRTFINKAANIKDTSTRIGVLRDFITKNNIQLTPFDEILLRYNQGLIALINDDFTLAEHLEEMEDDLRNDKIEDYQYYVVTKYISDSFPGIVTFTSHPNEFIEEVFKENNIPFTRDENDNISPVDNEFFLEESEDRLPGKRPVKRLKKRLSKLSDFGKISVTSGLLARSVELGNEIKDRTLLNQGAKGAIRLLEDGSAIIYALTNPDVSTPVHELAHFWEKQLTEAEKEDVLEWAGTGEEWNTETSEKFAKGFEKYLAEGKAPNSALKSIFENFKRWLKEVYKVIIGSEIDVQLNDSMRKIYAAMLGENFEEVVKQEIATEQVAGTQEVVPEAQSQEPVAEEEETNPVLEGEKRILGMSEEERDNTDFTDLGLYKSYNLYEARKVMPKKENSTKFKKVGEDFLFDYHYIANINGIPYGLTKQEDPDNPDDEKAFVWSYERLDGIIHEGDTYISDNKQLVDEIIATQNLKPRPLPKAQAEFFENLSKEEEAPAEIFTKEDEGSKVIYNGKEMTVSEVITTAKGNTMVTITDGTKYGEQNVFPEKLQKIKAEVVPEPFDEGLLKDINLAAQKEYKGEGQFTQSREDEDNLIIDYVGLKFILENLKSKYNIPYTVVDTDEDWSGRFEDGVVKININKVTRDTPFHEYLHPFIAVLKVDNEELYRSISSEANQHPDFKEELKKVKASKYYKDRSLDAQADEALVRFISRISAKNYNKEGRIVEPRYKEMATSLTQRFINWLNDLIEGFLYGRRKNAKRSEPSVTPLSKLPIEMTIKDIADITSTHGMGFDFKERMDLVNKMNEFQADVEAVSEEGKIIARIKRRLDVLEDTARRRTPSDVLMNEVIAIKSVLKNYDEVESINKYVEQGLDGLSWANQEFNRISTVVSVLNGRSNLDQDKAKTQEFLDSYGVKDGKISAEGLKKLNQSLGLVKNILAFYEDVHRLFSRISEDLDLEEYKEFSEVLRAATNTENSIRTRSVDLTTEWLFPYIEEFNEKIKERYPEFTLTKEEFRKKLYSADKDINFLFHWLGSVSSSSDPVSGVTRTALFDVMEQNHLFEAELGEDIKISYGHFLDNAGLKNEIKQTEEYYKNNYLRKATVLQRTDEKDENDKYKYAYAQKWAFHEEFFYDLYVKEKTDFLENLGERPEEGTPEYQVFVDKIFAWEDTNGSLSKPAERFRNPAYSKLYRKDEFFTKLYETYREANTKIGEDEALKYGVIPQVSRGRHAFSDIKNKEGIVAKAKEVKSKIVNFIVPQVENESTFSEDQQNLDGTLYKKITIPYTRPLEEDDISLVLPETVYKYAGSTNLVNLMREVEPNVVTLKSILEGNSKFVKEARKINKVTTDRNTIFDHVFGLPAKKEERISRLNKQLLTWIDDAVYGVTELQDSLQVGKRKIDLNKVGGNLAFLTALNNMAFNITAGISNVAIGNVLSFGESLGGKYYHKEDWGMAIKQYLGNTSAFMRDAFNLKKSKITQLGIKYDAIQGEFRDKYGKKFVGNVAQRYATADTIFFINHAAEHQIQLTGMLALMNATKVKTNSGELISLFDAHIVNEKGFLRLRNDIQWTAEDEKSFTRRLHGINKVLNGNYSKFDKVHLQRTWFGKLLLIYRKFMYNAFRTRYGRKRPDYEIGDVMEGYYRKFFTKLTADMKEYQFGMVQKFFKKEGWNEDEKYAANKTLYELSLLLAISIVTIGLAASGDDDKDKSWGHEYLALQALRLRSDLGMYSIFGATDMLRVVQNPSAVILTLKRYTDFTSQLILNPFQTYDRKTGAFDKGDSILKAKLLKALPIVRQYINMLQPEEAKKFFKLLNKY